MNAAVPGKGTHADLIIAVGLVGILALTVVPIPPALLDVLLAMSLCAAILTFLVAFYVERPLEFSAFPSLLLFVTLLRLSLNVATTRLILTNGDQGTRAAGNVIHAFGDFAVGSNFVVGAVVFLILVLVNFIVITKGAERISEVSARFTLDSMPGKQMAVDADLGAGLINEKEARARRKAIEQEADFHGAMDGASKFVRGDAIAGILIVAINIVGGMIIGIAQKGMSAGDAAHAYTTMSIGDGLVTQIPALLVSTGAALLITRTGDEPLASALGHQLLSRPRPIKLAAGILLLVGFLPGMPHIMFIALASLAWYGASRSARAQAARQAAGEPGTSLAVAGRPATALRHDPEAQKADIEAALPVELLSLDVGLDLLPMVDASKSGEILSRVADLRKHIALELGLIVPPVHVRDDLRLRPGGYRISISGVTVAEGEIRTGRLMAIDAAGRAVGGLPGEVAREPVFGLPAKWIGASERSRAEAAGCTVVDASSVVATHVTEVIRRHAADLLGRREVQELLDLAARHHSKVVEELIPHLMSLGDVIKVLRSLLRENVSIRDLRTILEALADHSGQVKDPGELTELVRQRLARRITRQNLTDAGQLRALVLSPRAEELFRDGGTRNARALSKLTGEIEDHTRRAVESDVPAVLVVAPDIRRSVAAVAQRHVPGLTVLSYREVDPSVPFVTHNVIGGQENAA
jgi:flagellar biosynthesis protein FlhA